MVKRTHPSLAAGESVALGEMIRKWREKAGLSQDALGVMIGLPQARIAEIETAKRRIDVYEFVRLAHAVKANPVQLFEEFVQVFEPPN